MILFIDLRIMEKRLKRYLIGGKFKDVPEARSRTMSAIRGKHTRSTELCLRMALIRKGISGWSLHAKELPGNPDFYFKSKRLAVFVDGCFWHGCPLCGHIPKTHSKFWAEKIELNQLRDEKKREALRKLGVSTIRIWEHELRDNARASRIIARITKFL